MVDQLLLELFGICEALTWLKDINRTNTIIEFDYLMAIRAVNGSVNFQSSIDFAIIDCRSLLLIMSELSLLSSLLTVLLMLWLKQLGSISSLHVWRLSPSDCIAATLAADFYY